MTLPVEIYVKEIIHLIFEKIRPTNLLVLHFFNTSLGSVIGRMIGSYTRFKDYPYIFNNVYM